MICVHTKNKNLANLLILSFEIDKRKMDGQKVILGTICHVRGCVSMGVTGAMPGTHVHKLLMHPLHVMNE